MVKYWISLVLLIAFDAYCLYATMFFAWVTATPVAPENLKRAQMLAQNWSIAFLATSATIILLIIRMVRLRRRTSAAQESIAS